MLKVVHDAVEPNENDIVAGRSLLDEIVRDGARQMLAAALQAEVAAYIEAHAGEVDERELNVEERVVYNAELDASISAAARTIRFGEIFAARGVTTVALDEHGRLTRHHPDGTTNPLE